MIPIKTYENYGEGFLALNGIDSFCMVVSEKHLVKKLPKHDGIVMALVYPSFDSISTGSIDNDGKEIMGLLFVLKKVAPGNEDEVEELDTYAYLQTSLLSVENKLKEDYQNGHEVMQNLVVDSLHIDPEYQVFGGYNGWSMSFKLNWY